MSAKRKPRSKMGRPITGTEVDAGERRRLAAGRVARGLTRAELGVVLGVSGRTVQSWEQGQRRVPAERLARWREAAGVTPGLHM